MNTQITAQDAAAMSQEDFDALDSGTIEALLSGGGREPEGGSTPPPAQEHRDATPANDNGGQRNEPPPAQEQDDPEVITLDEDGRARNAKGKFVPHAALHKERETRKALQSERDNLRVENARYSERLNMLLQALEPEPKPKAAPAVEDFKPVNVEEDLIGAIKQMQEVALKGRGQPSQEVQQLRQRLDGFEAHNQVAAISNRYAADVNSAKADVANMPGFEDAVRHVVMQQDGMLAAQGWNDPAQRRQQIQQAERQFVMKAYQDGANPAKRLYDMAKATGWQPKANGAANGNGQTNGAPSAVEQKIDNIAKMQKGSPTLSNVVTTGGDSLPSAAQIAAMNEDDFDAFVDKIGGLKSFERRYLGKGAR